METLLTHFAQSSSKSDFAKRYFEYLSGLTGKLDYEAVGRIIETMLKAAEDGRTIFFMGNGGSAATASHFACDLSLNTKAEGLPPFRVISLTDNAGAITALGNDEGYENIFKGQLENLLQPEDVVVALSVSGNSENVLRAVRFAKSARATIIAMVGFDGGALGSLGDVCLHVRTPEGEYGPVEDIFQIMDHLLFTYIRLFRGQSLSHQKRQAEKRAD